MKPATKKLINYLLVSGLLLQSLSPMLAVATTVEESFTQETVSESTSENLKESVSSDSETVESTIESTTENVIEKAPVIPTEVEKEYDERMLNDENKADSPHPVIKLDEQKLDEQFLIEGKITAESIVEDNVYSKTLLKATILQKRLADSEWETVDKITLNENQEYSLNKEEVPFGFSSDADESAEYRLLLDYEVKRYENDDLRAIDVHKAQYFIKNKLEQNTKSTKALDKKDSEEMQHFFRLDRGISLFSSSFDHHGNIDNDYLNYVRIREVTKESGKISFQSSVTSVSNRAHPVYAVVHTDPEFIRNINGTHPQINRGPWAIVKQNALRIVNIPHTGGTITNAYHSREEVAITGLTPNTDYYVWMVYIRNRDETTEWAQHMSFSGLTNMNQERSYHFRTEPPTPLTNIRVPGFVQSSATTTSISMNGSSYDGDISQDANDGLVQITSNEGSNYETKITNLNHDTSTGGNYRGATITGLTPGTRYKGRVVLKDYDRIDRYSGLSSYFYTPNTVNQPGISALGTPTVNNNATANVVATYNVGNVAAHPSQVEVSISTNNSNWNVINTGTTPATTNPIINPGNKQVSFTLSKLNANTKYFVRYKVRNASNNWSADSESRNFTTKGIPVTIEPPNVTNITSVSATAGNNTYTGTVLPNQGFIQYSNESGTGMESQKATNLPYSNGNYGTVELTNLYPGSKYRARTSIMASNNVPAWSEWTDDFVTPTILTDLELTGKQEPTTATNGYGSATFKGFYQAATNMRERAAHPDKNKIKVEIQEVGTSSWVNVNLREEDRNIDFGNKRITFKVNGLKAGAAYNVRYKVENGKNNGSANEVWSDPKQTNNIVSMAVIPLEVVQPKISELKVSNTATPVISAVVGNSEYRGNVSPSRGRIEYSSESGAGMIITKAENLTHPGTIGGTYGKLTISGLRAGAKYRARAVLKKPGPETPTSDTYSEWTSFVTPTIPTVLTTTSTVKPTNATNAEAVLSGFYAAATQERENPAYPNDIEVQIRKNGTSQWQTVRVHDLNFDFSSRKRVTFRLKGLSSKTVYDVRYKIENGIGNFPQEEVQTEVWSNWTECEGIISTQGIQLRINGPTIPQAENAIVGPTFVQLHASKYYGDISATWANGQFKMMKASETNWLSATTVYTDLVHDRVTGVDGTASNINYNGARTISGLAPGTKYKGRLTVPDYEEVAVDSPETVFCTTLTVNTPTASATERPITVNTAKATVSGSYNVDVMSPAHPDPTRANDNAEVAISLTGNANDFRTLVYNSTGTNPSLNSAPAIDLITKSVEFKLKNLKENTVYYVKYRMKNESNKWSDWSTANTVTTLTRMPGYYFENVPEFNFGSLTRSDVDTTNPLASTSGSFNMEIENIGMVNNWVLSAKLSSITTFDGSNLELTNAALIVGKKLSRSSDGGATWPEDVSSTFNVGNSGYEVLPSNTSVELWKSPNSASAQGKFKYTIDRNSVQLKVLGGTAQATREYRGKVTWTMDTLP
ncbi:WxL domain-containing protein [Enterococcus sp. AZ072]|uniref:WxL domain-containing protein n=1 Tax=unclassified Enterococcus TaxID=2608891 RepID=UPI003D27A275